MPNHYFLQKRKFRVESSGYYLEYCNMTKNLNAFDWPQIQEELNRDGFTILKAVLSAKACGTFQTWYDEPARFRKTIQMERYRFGQGAYRYFEYPLPGDLQELRTQFYERLAPLANQWMSALRMRADYPPSHEEFISRCRQQGQVKATPLILKYEQGGYNTLHQDLYGDIYFPFQVVLPLSQRGVDYEGGELVFLEQIPRAQSRATVLTPDQGDAIIFTTQFRPVLGTRGYYRAALKHGISRVTSGKRLALGVIFHDAQ